MFILKNTRGYWEAWETREGKRRYIKYIGKDPTPYYASLAKGAEILEAIKRYPDLAVKGSGQAILAEAQRRQQTKAVMPIEQYQTIVIDPPWPMGKIPREVRPNQFEMDYPVMSIEGIKALALPADSNCHVYLWTTEKFIPIAFQVLEAWGISYVFTLVWHKSGGFQPYGLPQYNCEFALFGRKGQLDFLDTKAFPVCFTGERREHSRKPVEFYRLVSRVSPGPRLDMFSREQHEGFERWGNEPDKFNS